MRQTYSVAAAVDTELSGESDSGTEPEDDNQTLEHSWEHSVHAPRLVEGGRKQEEECEHGENDAKHDVVDDCWVGAHCDHVSDQCHDNDSDEELATRSVSCGMRESVAKFARTCRTRSATLTTFISAVE